MGDGLHKKRRVILVTDGDRIAQRAVEVAARNVGARCISRSAGNPTRQSGQELVELIKEAPLDPVVVMLDDRGFNGPGRGESALAYIAGHPDIEVLGVLAVASNTEKACGCRVNVSVTQTGEVIEGPVDKWGLPKQDVLKGDTTEILDSLKIPFVIGIGDIGKMGQADAAEKGAPLTTKAFQTILERSGFNVAGQKKQENFR
ncbi:MAG TPA: stage V sporulation protein AE [Bacillota bacterium]|jgi:stage V sporulation protein AE|nr:stage V sporulation protein AE [Peptococcaceae bacterium MAG4]HPU35625.1 stage V sporulation protein AE [Bacillota bacterium]HPZ42486.1 stage V sporulation protein AE [Bacillota bacterium]HQD75278.1 stage V sporulation protein AE [Bacillota bacterium]HUM57713.1 stage V sporulation protein AE [Bacillota bacterium]